MQEQKSLDWEQEQRMQRIARVKGKIEEWRTTGFSGAEIDEPFAITPTKISSGLDLGEVTLEEIGVSTEELERLVAEENEKMRGMGESQ